MLIYLYIYKYYKNIRQNYNKFINARKKHKHIGLCFRKINLSNFRQQTLKKLLLGTLIIEHNTSTEL